MARTAAASIARMTHRYQEVQRRTWCSSRPVRPLPAWKFSSAHPISPATGQGLRWGQRPPEDHHESSQTGMIRRWPPPSSTDTPEITIHGRSDALARRHIASSWPQQGLRDDHPLAVERHSGASVQAVPECDRLANPAAELSVIRAGQDSVDRQAIRGSTHAASISDQYQPNQRNCHLPRQITIYGWSTSGVRPVGSARRGHWPLLVAGPLSGVAGRLLPDL